MQIYMMIWYLDVLIRVMLRSSLNFAPALVLELDGELFGTHFKPLSPNLSIQVQPKIVTCNIKLSVWEFFHHISWDVSEILNYPLILFAGEWYPSYSFVVQYILDLSFCLEVLYITVFISYVYIGYKFLCPHNESFHNFVVNLFLKPFHLWFSFMYIHPIDASNSFIGR